MKLKIITKDSDVIRYVIGESPIEDMYKAISLEYDTGIHPLVVEKQNELKHKCMERYASLMVIHAMNRFGKGEMKLCPDECRSDLYFSTPEYPDLCLGIQVKTTSGLSETSYRFYDTNKDYSGLLMYFRSLKDGKSWLIPYDILKIFYKGTSVNVSQSNAAKIKWKQYEIEDKNLAPLIYEYFIQTIRGENTGLILESSKDITTATSINIQKEHITRSNLMPILLKTGLKIEAPIIESMVYDLIMGGLKIQEKKARSKTQKQDVSLAIELCRGSKEPYLEEDFSILIVHLPEPYEKSFYFIPTDKLIEHGFVKEKDQIDEITNTTLSFFPEEIGKRKTGNTSKNDWTVEFLCYYDDPNIDKRLIAIYNKQLLHESEIIILDQPIFWDIECKTINSLGIKWNLEITYPSEDSIYNFLLYNKKILLKCLAEMMGKFVITISYLVNKIKISYVDGDFDFIYADLPEKFKSFYLIPRLELSKRNLLINKNSKGKKTMSVPFPDSKVKYPHLTNSWVNDFIFKYDDPNIKEKLLNFLDSYD